MRQGGRDSEKENGFRKQLLGADFHASSDWLSHVGQITQPLSTSGSMFAHPYSQDIIINLNGLFSHLGSLKCEGDKGH